MGLAILETSENVLLRYVNGTYIRDADYTPPKRSRHYADHTWTTTKELPSGRLRLVAYSAYPGVDWSSEWQETDGTRLNSSIKAITHSIQTAAVGLISKLEEAERKAELIRQEWAAAEDRRRRDEDRRQAQKAHQDSQDHLRQIIQRWANVMSVEQFLQGVESQAARLSEGDKGPLLERLSRAREFLGTQDPLEFFKSWKTPEERYSRIYGDENETSKA